MNKVVTINLNGRAYQLEESGYEALRAYLDGASRALSGDPGRAEIVADLEQAIAEKCDKVLNSHKTVVSTDEIESIIKEMGPVEGGTREEGKEKMNADQKGAGASGARAESAPKRLYRIEEGAMIWGTCNGLAAYFGVDVTLVRLVFVLLAIFTGGGFCLAYGVMTLVIPEADTMQQKAAAYGTPFNAQELVNRVKEAQQIGERRWEEWKKQRRALRREHRHWRRAHRPSPVFGVLLALLAVVWILALISLVSTGAIFGWIVPLGIPLWLSVILLFVAYQLVTGPLKGARWSYQENAYFYGEWDAIGDGLSVLFIAIALVWAYLAVPQFQYFVLHLPDEIREALAAVQSWWQR